MDEVRSRDVVPISVRSKETNTAIMAVCLCLAVLTCEKADAGELDDLSGLEGLAERASWRVNYASFNNFIVIQRYGLIRQTGELLLTDF